MIYVQSDSEKKIPHHFDCACALYGAIENVNDYQLITFEEVQSGKFDSLIKSNLFVGSVEFMREVFSRIGLTDVRVPENSNRESRTMELGEAVKLTSEENPIFVKPKEIKLFTGLVLDGMRNSFLDTLPQDSPVLVYDVFKEEILSEWRVYIHVDKITDSRCYSGDFGVIPNYDYVNEVILSNKSKFPIAYTIDIGVLNGGENVVVEYNDMWAIGNYGMENRLYLRLLRERYFEIIKSC